MKNFTEVASKIYLNYYIIFKSEPQNQHYSPIVDLESVKGESSYHLLDGDLEEIIPAVEFCLHLPRVSLDTVNVSIDQVMAGVHVPHNIVMIPSYLINLFSRVKLPDFEKPTLIIYQDECQNEAKKLESVFMPKMKSLAVSELSSVYLSSIWSEISTLTTGIEGELCVPDFEEKRLGDINIRLLPQMFIENQFGTVGSYFSKYNTVEFNYEEVLNQAVFQKAKLTALSDLDKGLSKEEPEALVRKYIPKSRLPLTISYPGMPPKHKKMSGIREIPNIEKKAISLISAHHAISKSGYYYDCEPVKDELFTALNNLEDHCCKDNQKNSYIWKTLKEIGKLLALQLGDDGVQAMKRASNVTAFTNFPVGVAILPETTAPLCCHKPISYNPLTPLTRAMQIELGRTPSVFIGNSCKVIIAECLDNNDHIRPYSDHIWELVNELSQNNQNFNVVKKEITSVKSMKEFLKSNNNADILVISAHGRYSKERNVSGIVIGNETWIAHENEHIMPPLVLLSACHVSPRGSGSVNITDLLLRHGAIAVLGTFIPVDVRKNGLLMLRFFIYLIEAMNNNHKFRSVDEIWQFVVSSNAINEIVTSNDKLVKWANTKNSDGVAPIEEFMLHKSTGKLSYTNIYDDTITVLRDIADRDGLLNLLDNSISSQGYFPESVFYQFVGRPENIIVNEPILKKGNKLFENS